MFDDLQCQCQAGGALGFRHCTFDHWKSRIFLYMQKRNKSSITKNIASFPPKACSSRAFCCLQYKSKSDKNLSRGLGIRLDQPEDNLHECTSRYQVSLIPRPPLECWRGVWAWDMYQVATHYNSLVPRLSRNANMYRVESLVSFVRKHDVIKIGQKLKATFCSLFNQLCFNARCVWYSTSDS